ncbi:hypothetical protein ACA910_012101 [Epithemia clementina (nom. ined.)]
MVFSANTTASKVMMMMDDDEPALNIPMLERHNNNNNDATPRMVDEESNIFYDAQSDLNSNEAENPHCHGRKDYFDDDGGADDLLLEEDMDEISQFQYHVDRKLMWDDSNHWTVLTQMYGSVWPNVLPYCLLNMLLTWLFSYLKNVQNQDWTVHPSGHKYAATFMSFLLVTRVTIILNRYMENSQHLTKLLRSCRDLVCNVCLITSLETSRRSKQWRQDVAFGTLVLLRVTIAVLQFRTKVTESPWRLPEVAMEYEQESLKYSFHEQARRHDIIRKQRARQQQQRDLAAAAKQKRKEDRQQRQLSPKPVKSIATMSDAKPQHLGSGGTTLSPPAVAARPSTRSPTVVVEDPLSPAPTRPPDKQPPGAASPTATAPIAGHSVPIVSENSNIRHTPPQQLNVGESFSTSFSSSSSSSIHDSTSSHLLMKSRLAQLHDDDRQEMEEMCRAPLLVALNVRNDIMKQRDGTWLRHPLDVNQELRLLDLTNDFVGAITGLCKLVTTPIPFPLVQMNKTFLYVWLFTVPLAIAHEQYNNLKIVASAGNGAGAFFPPIFAMMIVFMITFGFLGLEYVSIELTDNFGPDPSDFDTLGLAHLCMEDCYLSIYAQDGKAWAHALRKRLIGRQGSVKAATTAAKPKPSYNPPVVDENV